MFVVQVAGKFSKKNEEFFLNREGKKTRYLGQAAVFPSVEAGTLAGQAFLDSGKGWSFSVDPS